MTATIPNATDLRIFRHVMDENMSIKDVANAFGVSPSTIRHKLDKVTNFRCADFDLTLDGSDILLIVGALRNSNHSSQALAERIARDVVEASKTHERRKAERARIRRRRRT